jgi:agmatinase
MFGVPFDRTSSFRMGSAWAPMEMRKASYNFETYNGTLDIDLAKIPIHDMGDMESHVNIDDVLEEVFEIESDIVKAGKIPIMMGGEHTLTHPCFKAFGKNTAFVVLDAHHDLRTDYRGVKQNHACVSRSIIEEFGCKYVSIGIRSGTKDEYEYVRKNKKIRSYTADQVEEMGIAQVLKEMDKYLKGCDSIYLSLDMDAIDPAYAPGLGTPEPFGMTPREVRQVIYHLAPRTVGFDVVEIAPNYDQGVTAILGAKFIREFIAAKWKSMKNL